MIFIRNVPWIFRQQIRFMIITSQQTTLSVRLVLRRVLLYDTRYWAISSLTEGSSWDVWCLFFFVNISKDSCEKLLKVEEGKDKFISIFSWKFRPSPPGENSCNFFLEQNLSTFFGVTFSYYRHRTFPSKSLKIHVSITFINIYSVPS